MAPLQLINCSTRRAVVLVPSQRIIDALDAALETCMEVVIWERRTPSAELVLRTWAKVHELYIDESSVLEDIRVVIVRYSADGDRVASLYLDKSKEAA